MKDPRLALFYSVMVPGLGQIYLGERAKGWTFLCMGAGVAVSLIVSHTVVACFLMGGIYLAVMIPAALDAFQTALGRPRTFSVPIPVNFRESEIGAVQCAIHDKKIKAWAGDTIPYVIVMLLLVGPFAIPLLWQSRRFSSRAKIVWTAVVIGIALFSIAVMTFAASFLEQLMNSGRVA
jgi:TM2 domain-containing membrane protein YozV